MPKSILALGLDPAFVDAKEIPGLSVAMVRAFIDKQIDRLRALGYEVDNCLVDRGATAESVTTQYLKSRTFDCVLIGAGLRAPVHLLLFEKLVNLVHALAPQAKICFNSSPADSTESVQRWMTPQ